MSKTQAMTAFRIIFTMLWYIASEITNKPVDNTKYNDLWNDAHKLMD